MSDPVIGEIRMFGGNFAPAGWAFCEGQLLPIAENEALFTLIGTTYGGNGETTFALPDLRARFPVHQNQNASLPMGQMWGIESVTLTVNHLPAHSHTVRVSDGLGDSYRATGNWLARDAAGATQLYTTGDTTGALKATAVTSTGGNQPHDNLPPYVVINFIIALEGVFPSQT